MGNSKEQLSEQVKNALTELGNIGAGNATTSLSVLLSSRLTMTAPIVKLYDFNALELEWHGDMGISAIGEIANILIGSYVASLGNLSGMELRYSQPQICIDMAGAILSVPCIEYGMISDKALLINSGFKAGNQEINGYIMLISEMHSFDQLLQKLGIGGAGGE